MAAPENNSQLTQQPPKEMYRFIKDCTPFHLTVADVKKLNVGEELDVVVWDRNFEEYWIWSHAESEKPYLPEEFFQSNRHTLKYLGNMTWEFRYEYGGNVVYKVELDVTALNTRYKWCNIESNGKIHITKDMERRVNKDMTRKWEEISKHWTDFPDTTRVGWRGPIMLWERLHCMPQVYNKDGYFGKDLTDSEDDN
jgi:hypothetical protein